MDFLNFEDVKIQKLHFVFLFKNLSLKIKLSQKPGTQVEYQWLMNMVTKFQVDIINCARLRRRVLDTEYFCRVLYKNIAREHGSATYGVTPAASEIKAALAPHGR